MTGTGDQPTCIVLGEQSLLIQCTEKLLDDGFAVLAVVAEDSRIRSWCAERHLPVAPSLADLDAVLAGRPFDYLFSITNLRMLPEPLLGRARKLAINFHDGPLPKYAGLNAPVWALIGGERQYGVSWHVMQKGADTGAILASREFPIEPDDTVFTLNARCYQNGLASFIDLLDSMRAGELRPKPQDLSQRSYFSATMRPHNAALLDWRRPVAELLRLVRALDFGNYPNPVLSAKILLGERLLLVRSAESVAAASDIPPGALQSFSADRPAAVAARAAARGRFETAAARRCAIGGLAARIVAGGAS
jgi:methionyl-tRNA formyltransferase